MYLDVLIKTAPKLKFYTDVQYFVYIGSELTREEAKTEHEAAMLRRNLIDNQVDRKDFRIRNLQLERRIGNTWTVTKVEDEENK